MGYKTKTMVDRRARDILAEQLRHLVSGQITNDEFNARLPIKTEDAGFRTIEEQAWLMYSDLYEHKIKVSHKLSRDDRERVSRAALFLHSDLEYEWPKHPCTGFIRLIAGMISLGRLPQYFDSEWKVKGDYDVYPFFRRADFDRANSNPRLLSGGKRV
jgi:hypothetical protein